MATISKINNGESLGVHRLKINENCESLNSAKVEPEQVLTRTNTLSYIPTLPYHPVTKEYADLLRTNWDTVFNPQEIAGDVFDRANHTGFQPAASITQDTDHNFVSLSQIDAWNAKENSIGAKGTAFNKDFGIEPGTVSEGNHTHTKESLGIGAVNNTSDFDKPISNATQEALDEKMGVGVAVLWKGKWVSGAYLNNDLVLDGGWTMIANKDTIDRAAPQPQGDPYYLYNGLNMIQEQITGKQVVFGTRYVADRPFYLDGYRVKVVAGNYYEIVAVYDPDGAKEVEFLNGFHAKTSGWRVFGLVPRPAQAGQAFEILAICSEPDTGPIEITANYNYRTPKNIEVPITGECVHSNNQAETLFFNHVDSDGTDRSADFASMQVGDKINLGPMTWAIQSYIDQGTYSEITVAPAELAPVADGVQQFILSTVQETIITYDVEPNYYSTDPNINGLFIEDGSWQDVAQNNNAYGIDILVQSAYVSPDWDLIAHSGNAGSGSLSASSADLPPYYFEKNINFSTNLQTAQLVAVVETRDIDAGVYEFAISWTWESTQTNSSVYFGYQTENAGTIGPIAEMRQEAKDATDKYSRYYAFPKDLIAGVKKLSFYAWTETSANTVTIDFCDVIIKRVG